MNMRRFGAARVLAAALLAVTAAALAPSPTAAQMGGPGFLFKRPMVSASIHAGIESPTAGSDLFSEYAFTEWILERRDFDGPFVGGELAIRAGDRWDVALEVGHAWSTTAAESRPYVEDDGSPIWQDMRFARTPVTLSGKFYLTERGRSIGRFAWIPNRITPFLGAGAGLMHYRFVQEGDFVDYGTLEIFYDRLESSGTTLTAHGLAGVDVHLTKALFLTAQARYSWAEAGLDRTVFQDFEPIDLSGFRVTLGLGARF